MTTAHRGLMIVNMLSRQFGIEPLPDSPAAVSWEDFHLKLAEIVQAQINKVTKVTDNQFRFLQDAKREYHRLAGIYWAIMVFNLIIAATNMVLMTYNVLHQ